MSICKVATKWIRNKSDEIAADEGYYFDIRYADRFRYFCQFLRQSKGQWAGKPFELLDYQWNDIVAPMFGWRRPDGLRRFNTVQVWIPKKNGKSTIGAALSLYFLVADNESMAEVYTSAVDSEQAAIVFKEAAAMVESSPELSERLQVVRYKKTINDPRSLSVYKALSADVPKQHGINWHFLLFDEMHAYSSRESYDTLLWGNAARRQPMMMIISTAGDQKSLVGRECYDQAKRVSKGEEINLSLLPVIYEASQDDNIESPDVWRKANPSFDVVIKEDEMRRAYDSVKSSPAGIAAFRRLRLNQWVQSDSPWLDIHKWDACQASFEEQDFVGHECYAGLDLADTTDTTALVLLFEKDNRLCALPYIFAPAEIAKERERLNRQRYDPWFASKHIIKMRGSRRDDDVILAEIDRLRKLFKIRAVAFDTWQASYIAKPLEQRRLDPISFGQGFASMSVPCKGLEAAIVSRQFAHNGHPVLRWMAGNVHVEMDAAGNIKPTKKKSSDKIDGIVALIMSFGLHMAFKQKGNSVYKERGALVF